MALHLKARSGDRKSLGLLGSKKSPGGFLWVVHASCCFDPMMQIRHLRKGVCMRWEAAKDVVSLH